VNLDNPIGNRFDGATRAVIEGYGEDSVAAHILKFLDHAFPESVYIGLAPLNNLFLKSYEETYVKELKSMIMLLKKEISLSQLINVNLLVDMVHLFSEKTGETLFDRITMRNSHFLFTRAGHIISDDYRPFGYVGETKGSLLTDLIENYAGKEMVLTFLKELLHLNGKFQKTSSDPKFPQKSGLNESRCTDDGSLVECEKHSAKLDTGLWLRNVLWQVPLGNTPVGGWPVVLHFQGSFFAPHLFSWRAAQWMPFGAYEQAKGIKGLLDAGFAVITPESHLQGFTFWDTNIPPFSFIWELAPDHLFMEAIFEEIRDPNGLFGRLNSTNKFATGISSGGYMTSRMAVSYPGEFVALAVCAGSYATCAGPLCIVPPLLPRDHPPTLFIHGSIDPIVPLFTMELYEEQLASQGIVTKKYIDPLGFHEWIDGSAQVLVDWMVSYRK